MKHCARAVFAVTLIASLIAGSIHASRVPGTPQLPTERKVYEIYNDRYDTAYESSAELDAMRVHDMDFFDLPENHYVYVQGIAHCANDNGGFGWYRPILPDGGITHALFFTVTIPQVDDLTLNGDYTATFTPPTEWGFYMRRPDGTMYYSESHRNPDNADQLLVYATPDENTFLICWEDRADEASDYDHNDLILEMTFVPVPEN